MNSGKTVFSQLMDFLPSYQFRLCVNRYHGNYKVKRFSCWDQFLSMAFAQLTYRESLRDIETCLRAVGDKLYHMGIRGKVSRNTLAHSNEVRDWRIYQDFAQVLIRHARELYLGDPHQVQLDQTAYALDSTIVDLCLTLFPLGEVSKAQGSGEASHPSGLTCQHPYHSDCHYGSCPRHQHMDELFWEPGSIYVMDRGYVDFSRLYRIQQDSAFFVTRAKKNFRFQRLYSHRVNKPTGLRCDQTISLCGFYAQKDYPASPHPLLRPANQQDSSLPDQQLYLTTFNHRPTVSLPLAGGIVFQVDQATPSYQGLLRCQRQCRENTNLDRHLDYVLVAIIKKRLNLDHSLYSVLQVLSVTIMEKTPIFQVLSQFDEVRKNAR
jgi:hypothetical protein